MTNTTESKVHSAPVRTALSATQIIASLAKVDGWKLHGDGADVAIEKTYRFDNFLKTMAFVNALAYIAEQQDHHPELLVSYKLCVVSYRTDSAGGALSRNDFICAARASALAVQRTAP